MATLLVGGGLVGTAAVGSVFTAQPAAAAARQIQVVLSDGAFVYSLPDNTQGAVDPNGEISFQDQNNFVNGLAVDTNNNIYDLDLTDGIVAKYNSDQSGNSTVFYPTACPNGIATASSGDIFISDSCANTIVEFNQAGTAVRTVTNGGAPSTMAVDRFGNVFFVNGSDIDEITAASYATTPATSFVTVATGLSSPNGIAINPINGDLFVSEPTQIGWFSPPSSGTAYTVNTPITWSGFGACWAGS